MANHTGKGIPDRKLTLTILPDDVPVTQTMGVAGTRDEAGASPYV